MSVLTVLYIYWSDKREKRFERKSNIQLFWYQDLFLHEYSEKFTNFFKQVSNISGKYLEEPSNVDKLALWFSQFNDIYGILITALMVSPLDIYQGLIDSLRDHLINFEDSIIDEIGKIHIQSKSKTEEISRDELFGIIYHHKNLLFNNLFISHNEILNHKNKMDKN